MTNSEIIKEMHENWGEMQKLIERQKFCIKDAEEFLSRYFNMIRRLEQLEKSRDNWKIKHDELKKKLQEKENE